MDSNLKLLNQVIANQKKFDRIRYKATGGKYGNVPIRNKSTSFRRKTSKKIDAELGYEGGADPKNAG